EASRRTQESTGNDSFFPVIRSARSTAFRIFSFIVAIFISISLLNLLLLLVLWTAGICGIYRVLSGRKSQSQYVEKNCATVYEKGKRYKGSFHIHFIIHLFNIL